MLRFLSIVCVSLCFHSYSYAESFDHGIWNKLVNDNVHSVNENATNQVTTTDYDAMENNNAQLEEYLNKLSEITIAEFDNWSTNEQLAFLINAYNAATVKMVLTGYPDIESIRDLGFLLDTPFRRDFIMLFGETISLDDIEKGRIIGSDNYNDPRAHFALNCASISCPALRTEAYSGDTLDTQLNDQMAKFLSDPERNRLDDDVLWVSKIFSWYDDDFRSGWQNITSLEEFFVYNIEALSLSPRQSDNLINEKIKIKYLDYDWNLNEAR